MPRVFISFPSMAFDPCVRSVRLALACAARCVEAIHTTILVELLCHLSLFGGDYGRLSFGVIFFVSFSLRLSFVGGSFLFLVS